MPIFFTQSVLKRLFPRLLTRTPKQVKRSSDSYKVSQGWRLSGGAEPMWHGYYRSKYGSFKGRVENFADPKFYIELPNPPERLRKHKHWICFHDQKKGGEYWVHLSPVPADIDSGIFAVERNLNEALAPIRKTA
jgi:hypothetical protein